MRATPLVLLAAAVLTACGQPLAGSDAATPGQIEATVLGVAIEPECFQLGGGYVAEIRGNVVSVGIRERVVSPMTVAEREAARTENGWSDDVYGVLPHLRLPYGAAEAKGFDGSEQEFHDLRGHAEALLASMPACDG